MKTKVTIVHENLSFGHLEYDFFKTFEEAKMFYFENENKLDVLYVNYFKDEKYFDESESIFYDN